MAEQSSRRVMRDGAPKVFLDTSVMKDAATRVFRGFKRSHTAVLGDTSVTVPVVQYRIVPVLRRPSDPLLRDAAMLPLIAMLAKRGRIELLWHEAAMVEFWRQPNRDSIDGQFYGAPITWVRSPNAGGGISALTPGLSWRERMLQNLRSRKDPRFLELQVAAGVKEGSKKIDNQLLDAWHLWCAELAGATYFLTADRKLIKHVRQHRRHPPLVIVVTPRELIKALLGRRQIGAVETIWLSLKFWGARYWRWNRSDLERWDDWSAQLERQGYYDEK
jgi:hypothetical protein